MASCRSPTARASERGSESGSSRPHVPTADLDPQRGLGQHAGGPGAGLVQRVVYRACPIGGTGDLPSGLAHVGEPRAAHADAGNPGLAVPVLAERVQLPGPDRLRDPRGLRPHQGEHGVRIGVTASPAPRCRLSQAMSRLIAAVPTQSR